MRHAALSSTIAIAFASLSLSACTTATGTSAPLPTAAPAEAPPAPPQVPTQLPRTVNPLHYTIDATPDAANLRFAANTAIDVEVLEATDSITLNAAELQFGSVSLSGPGGTRRASDISVDPAQQTATFRFGAPLTPGRYRLDIAYTGKINTQATGLFALDYQDGGKTKRVLYTQFEAPDARRFFPGWDEPIYRTPYDLKLRIPAGQDAVSNMPVASKVPQADGTSIVTFQTTPAMSSYLLFVGVGEFDRITKMSGPTEVGVVTKRGDGEKGREALDGSAQILPYYNDYFGIAYPLPKLDNVAGPGSSQFFSAMENWGAIFTFENTLLVDPAITSDATRQRIFGVAAHEMAHQWFGDLVTMAWWSELWLNEGFASWMATKATDALHPEWETGLTRVDNREKAMHLDSVASTHPVVQEIKTVEQSNQAFDAIAYEKGEAVITMLENYVGADAWRQGVRDYISTYKYGNTVSDNLWEKIEGAAGKPIKAIAHDFTLQPGVPLIRVAEAQCVGGNTNLSLEQGEFSRDRKDKQPLAWRVPVAASVVGGGGEQRTLVEGGKASMTVPGCGPVIVNKGQAGYYRTLYTAKMLDDLTARYTSLDTIDQIGLLSDNWALGLAGYQSPAEALDFIDAIPADANPQLWSRAAVILDSIHRMYAKDKAHQDLVARYAAKKLLPVFNRLGWSPKAGEKQPDALLRAMLIAVLGDIGEPSVVKEANRRFLASATDPGALSGPLRTTILGVAAKNIDAAGWDRLREQARVEKSALVREQLYKLLGSADDEALARKALALALTDEPGLTNSSGMMAAVADGHPELAFDFALQNREKVDDRVDVASRTRFFSELADGSADPAMIAKLEDYATRYLTPDSRRPADEAIATIRDRIRTRERLGDISRWLDAHAR